MASHACNEKIMIDCNESVATSSHGRKSITFFHVIREGVRPGVVEGKEKKM